MKKNNNNFLFKVRFLLNFFKNTFSKENWVKLNYLFQKNFVTKKVRPNSLLNPNFDSIDETDDVAILIRGPIVKFRNFTLNTIDSYRRYYPKANIFVSTWNSYENFLLKYKDDDKVTIILNDFPQTNEGIGSTNLQIIGNTAGLKYIKKKNIKYSISLRSDQRFYSKNILKYLKVLISNYPYKPNSKDDKQIERLIGFSFNTFKYRLYGLSDMFLFGLTEDVLNYWDCELDKRNPSTFKNYDFKDIRDYSLKRIYEVYFMTLFLEKNGHDLLWDIIDYWDVISKRFIIVDSKSLDFLWPKYSNKEDRWNKYKENYKFEEISNLDWMLMYKNQLLINNEIINTIK